MGLVVCGVSFSNASTLTKRYRSNIGLLDLSVLLQVIIDRRKVSDRTHILLLFRHRDTVQK